MLYHTTSIFFYQNCVYNEYWSSWIQTTDQKTNIPAHIAIHRATITAKKYHASLLSTIKLFSK